MTIAEIRTIALLPFLAPLLLLRVLYRATARTRASCRVSFGLESRTAMKRSAAERLRPKALIGALRLAVFIFLYSPQNLTAQYIFLDANRDGRNDVKDQVPHSGWTEIDVWLDTARNRDGSRSALARDSRQKVAAYELLVQGAALSLEWGQYTPARPSMKVAREFTDAFRFYIRTECSEPLALGKHRLGTIRLRSEWGEGTVSIIPCGLLQDTVRTSFVLEPGGTDLRLGPTVGFAPAPAVLPGDWHDADGVPFSSEPRPSAGPVRVESGLLYLGLNRMGPPFELRIIRGRPVVNGLTPPEERSKAKQASNSARAQFTTDVFAFSVWRTFSALGVPDTIAARALAEAYRLSPAVDSVQTGERFVDVFPRGSRILLSYRAFTPSASGLSSPKGHVTRPEERMLGDLEQWARILRDGHLLIIRHMASRTIVPHGRAQETDRALGCLQAGTRLSQADSAALLNVAPISEWAAIAHPERLEKIRP